MSTNIHAPYAPVATIWPQRKGWGVGGGRKRLASAEELEARLRRGQGLTAGETAKVLGIDRATVKRWFLAGQSSLGMPFGQTIAPTGYRLSVPEQVLAILDAAREQHEAGGDPRPQRAP